MHLLPAPPTLVTQTMNSSERSVRTYRTTQSYIPEIIVYCHDYENHNSHVCVVSSQFEKYSDLHCSAMKFGM